MGPFGPAVLVSAGFKLSESRRSVNDSDELFSDRQIRRIEADESTGSGVAVAAHAAHDTGNDVRRTQVIEAGALAAGAALADGLAHGGRLRRRLRSDGESGTRGQYRRRRGGASVPDEPSAHLLTVRHVRSTPLASVVAERRGDSPALCVEYGGQGGRADEDEERAPYSVETRTGVIDGQEVRKNAGHGDTLR